LDGNLSLVTPPLPDGNWTVCFRPQKNPPPAPSSRFPPLRFGGTSPPLPPLEFFSLRGSYLFLVLLPFLSFFICSDGRFFPPPHLSLVPSFPICKLLRVFFFDIDTLFGGIVENFFPWNVRISLPLFPRWEIYEFLASPRSNRRASFHNA